MQSITASLGVHAWRQAVLGVMKRFLCGRVGPEVQQPPAAARSDTCGQGGANKLFLVPLALALSDTLERLRTNLAEWKETVSEVVDFLTVT